MSNIAYCYSLLSFKLTQDNFTTDGKRVLFCGEWVDCFRDVQDLLEEKLKTVKLIYNSEDCYFIFAYNKYIENDDYGDVRFIHQELDHDQYYECEREIYTLLINLEKLGCKNFYNCEVKYHGFCDIER